jgi:hypothetical protein
VCTGDLSISYRLRNEGTILDLMLALNFSSLLLLRLSFMFSKKPATVKQPNKIWYLTEQRYTKYGTGEKRASGALPLKNLSIHRSSFFVFCVGPVLELMLLFRFRYGCLFAFNG